MGRKSKGVGSFSVSIPMDVIQEVQNYMDKHDVSRSYVISLALQKLFGSKSTVQQEHHSKEIVKLKRDMKKLENKLRMSEEEIESSTSFMETYVNKAEELHTQNKQYASERKKLIVERKEAVR
ncbi:MAG: hypothetical protein MK215_01810 [Candidatus Poseidoniia archaeon]|nr:hypothetical protein [Candidatus Poseidoniia archaeon]